MAGVSGNVFSVFADFDHAVGVYRSGVGANLRAGAIVVRSAVYAHVGISELRRRTFA